MPRIMADRVFNSYCLCLSPTLSSGRLHNKMLTSSIGQGSSTAQCSSTAAVARRPGSTMASTSAYSSGFCHHPCCVSKAFNRTRSKQGARRIVTRMMPIGVPRVPFRSRKAGGWQWIDIWNCLYRERIIFLGQALDEELGNQLIGTMLYLDSENHKDLRLYINCTGGDLVPSLALHDTMKHVESQVATVAFGAAMGMSGFLLATGQKGKRVVLPNTMIMLHHPSGAARGQASDLHNEARELMRLRNYVNHVLADATGQPLERVQFDFNRNKYFSADAAVEYGVVDRILKAPRQRLATAPQ